MNRPDRVDVAIVAAAVVAAGAATLALDQTVAEWVFFGVLGAAAGFVARALVAAWRSERRERQRAERARSLQPTEAAAEAVRRERVRMADDIAASLRAHLIAVRDLASQPSAESARRIHGLSRQAASELRRHLGLLRDASEPETTTQDASEHRAALSFGDLVLGALTAAIALVEASAYRATETGLAERGWATVALTVATAFAVTWRRAAPVIACWAAACGFALGVAVDEGVLPGVWLLIGAGGLLWGTLARPGRAMRDTVAGVVLVAAAGASTSLTDPDNATITWLLLVTLAVIAGGIGTARQLAARSAREASAHEAVIGQASREAVSAERAAFARELHDTVSHAVGLIAMQAAAAEVTWYDDEAGARRSLETIAATAAATLADLDRLRPGAVAVDRQPEDLLALIARIESAGIAVKTEGLDLIPAEALPVAYRVIQESLTNVLRHAGGASARVEVRRGPDCARITVADNGPGGSAGADRGYGLVGLRERVEFAGGSLRTGSEESGGFVVEAVLPA